MNDGLSLSPSTDGAKDGTLLPISTDGLKVEEGTMDGFLLSLLAVGLKEGVCDIMIDGLLLLDSVGE